MNIIKILLLWYYKILLSNQIINHILYKVKSGYIYLYILYICVVITNTRWSNKISEIKHNIQYSHEINYLRATIEHIIKNN